MLYTAYNFFINLYLLEHLSSLLQVILCLSLSFVFQFFHPYSSALLDFFLLYIQLDEHHFTYEAYLQTDGWLILRSLAIELTLTSSPCSRIYHLALRSPLPPHVLPRLYRYPVIICVHRARFFLLLIMVPLS